MSRGGNDETWSGNIVYMKEMDVDEWDGGLRQYAGPEGRFGWEGVTAVLNRLSAAVLHGR